MCYSYDAETFLFQYKTKRMMIFILLDWTHEDYIIYEQICLWFDLILYSLGSFEGGCGGKAVLYLVYPKVTTKLLKIINQVPQTF